MCVWKFVNEASIVSLEALTTTVSSMACCFTDHSCIYLAWLVNTNYISRNAEFVPNTCNHHKRPSESLIETFWSIESIVSPFIHFRLLLNLLIDLSLKSWPSQIYLDVKVCHSKENKSLKNGAAGYLEHWIENKLHKVWPVGSVKESFFISLTCEMERNKCSNNIKDIWYLHGCNMNHPLEGNHLVWVFNAM